MTSNNYITVASVALCLAVSSAIAADGPKPAKLFLLGGQSNMKGQGVARQLQGQYATPPANVKLWCNGQWGPLAADARGTFGPEIAFGHAISKATPDEVIYLVKYAVGGTALYNDWAPTNGPQYKGFMATAESALADLAQSKTEYTFEAMLWLQGESDAAENRGALYEENLTQFIAHMRSKFNAPEMPFIIARVRSFYGGKTGQAKLVRDAQVKIAESSDTIAWFDTDDCALLNQGHYNSTGLFTVGERFAKAYQQF